MFLCPYYSASSVPLPQPLWCHDATDGKTRVKESSVLNRESQAFLASVGQWAKVEITRRCDLVPKEGPHRSSDTKTNSQNHHLSTQ